MTGVLLLGNRLDPGTAADLSSLCGRLAAREVATRLVCVAAGEVPPSGFPVLERPGLASPVRRPWIGRRLKFDDGWRPGIIHALEPDLAPVALALSERWDCPYLLSVPEFLATEARLSLGRRGFRGLVAPSEALADHLEHSFAVPRSWIAVLPFGIELPDPADYESQRPLRSLPVVGMTMPRAIDRGLIDFLEAAQILVDRGQDVEFVIAGEGRGEATLRRLSRRLGLADRVTFAVEHDLGEAFWSVFDVYCQASDQPSTGLAVGLAMAHACPVVVSDVAGLRDWVAPGLTGLRVPPRDPAALATAIQHLLIDPDHAARLGQAARAWVAEACDPDSKADRLAALYHGILQTT